MRLVYVADREADILEPMARARDLGTPADWLLRAKHDRALPDGRKLWASALATTPLGEVRFVLPSVRGRSARVCRTDARASLKSPARSARLGGVLGRTGDGEPGVKTIWLGLQRVMDFAAGIRFAREAHDL